MKVLVTHIYEYDELSAQAKEKALEEFRKYESQDYCLSDDFMDMAIDDLAYQYGISDAQISFDIRCCQGDYFSIESGEFDFFASLDQLKAFDNSLSDEDLARVKHYLSDYEGAVISLGTGGRGTAEFVDAFSSVLTDIDLESVDDPSRESDYTTLSSLCDKFTDVLDNYLSFLQAKMYDSGYCFFYDKDCIYSRFELHVEQYGPEFYEDGSVRSWFGDLNDQPVTA